MKVRAGSFATLLLFCCLTASPRARAADALVTGLYQFSGFSATGSTNADGAQPYAGLTLAPDGNFYGVTTAGGSGGSGVVYRITPAGQYTVIHTFSAASGSGNPQSTLLLANDGFLYGSTTASGSTAFTFGTIFKIAPDGSGFQTVHAFNGTDGSFPQGPLIQTTDGNFYGTTRTGGATGAGTIFRLSPSGALTVLHNLNSALEGSRPRAGVVQAPDGSFYGVTGYDGSQGRGGTAFRIDSAGNFTVLHTFNGDGNGNGPVCLTLGNDGNLYGLTYSAGANGQGTFFRLTVNGDLTTLHSFANNEGGFSLSTLLKDGNGNFYATTQSSDFSAGTILQLTPTGQVTLLHTFPLTDSLGTNPTGAGGFPVTGLTFGPDQNLYGTTAQGGAAGTGTIFRLTPSAGEVRLATGLVNVSETAGSVSFTLQRVGGSSGAVSVSYATVNDSALSGVDYTNANDIVTWADGDFADKLVTVPIIDRRVYDGSSKTFFFVLGQPTGGASLGTRFSTAVNLFESNDQPQAQLVITSPPADLTVVEGSPLPLSASLVDPAGLVTGVQFSLNGATLGASNGVGAIAVDTVAPGAGTYVLQVAAFDNQGRQTTSTRTVTVLPADAANPPPTIAILTGSPDGRALAARAQISFAVSAFSNTGDSLAQVDFYADGVLFRSYDGSGNQLTSAFGTDRPVRRDAANSDIFQVGYQLPGANKLVNLVAVAIDKLGRSRISPPVSVQAVATTAQVAPTVSVDGLSNGDKVKVNANITVSVAASTPSARVSRRPTARAFDVSTLVAKLEYFLNGLKIAEQTQPPFAFSFSLPSAGTSIFTAIATDGLGVATVSPAVRVEAVDTPIVSIEAKGDATALESGKKGKFVITRSGGDLSTALTVNYKVKGSAINSVDYATLTKSVFIPAGLQSVILKLKPINNAIADGPRSVKLKLSPSATEEYDLGSPTKATVTIIDDD